MKKVYSVFRGILPLLILLVSAGCMNVEYVGQTLPSLPTSTSVKVFSPENPLPAGYRSIGKVTLTAPPRTSGSDIRQRLIALAREKGAEAVNVVSSKRIQVGLIEPDAGPGRMPNWEQDPRNAGGRFIYSNSFGNPAALPTAKRQALYDVQVQALLMVTDSRFNAMQQLYREQRARLEAQERNIAGKPVVLPPDKALDKAVKPLEVSPVPKKEPAPELKPVQLNLGSDKNPSVKL